MIWSTPPNVKEEEIKCGFYGNVFDVQAILPAGSLQATRIDVPLAMELYVQAVSFNFPDYSFECELIDVLPLPMTQRKCWTLRSLKASVICENLGSCVALQA